MGSRTKQRVDKEFLDSMVLSAYSNMVLIRIPNFEKERKTRSGIVLDVNPHIQYMDDGPGSHMADLARVIGIVEKVPPGLRPDGDILQWETEMELEPGDTVVFDYYDSLNSTSFIIDGDEYQLLPYSSCYLGIRDSRKDNMICLNGYCMFEDVLLPDDGFSPYRKVDVRRGKVLITGSPVKYSSDYWIDDIDIRGGDIVEFRKNFSRVYLERQKHFQELDKRMFRAQRKDIIYNHGKNM